METKKKIMGNNILLLIEQYTELYIKCIFTTIILLLLLALIALYYYYYYLYLWQWCEN